MLSVGLIFLYVLWVAYITGFVALRLVERCCTDRKSRRPEAFWRTQDSVAVVMAGLVVLTVYAQIFSLFYKVGFLANLLLVIFCAAAAVLLRRQLKERILAGWADTGRGKKIFYVFLFLLFAYGTSRGLLHYDTGLYHAQSIRWIEEYGVVKGLGNLHCRLAYNSSSFCLSALFSFAFPGGQSFHCMAGFLALLLAAECSKAGASVKERRLRTSDLARVMGIYYLLTVFDEMVSPASDYFMVLTVFYLLIRWLTLLEKGVKDFLPYGLLCLLAVHVVGIKLSAAFIVLLAVKPAVSLIRERNGRATVSLLLMGTVILAPYLIRNVWISGWLVYPFTFPDLFTVDWKIPRGIAAYDAREIQVWGRGLYDVAKYEEPVRAWFPAWLSVQGRVDQAFILSGIGAVLALLPAAAVILYKGIKRRRRDLREGLDCREAQGFQRGFDYLVTAAAVDLSFLCWLLSAPLMRYGCVYVYLAAVVTFLGPLLYRIRSRTLLRAAYACLLLLAGYKLLMFGRELSAAYEAKYFICQKDYEDFEVKSYEIDGYTFYYAAQGDRTGYDAFPSSPVKADIRLRGKTLKEGFLPGP